MTIDPMDWLQDDRRLSLDVLLEMGVKAADHPTMGRVVAFQYFRDGKPYAAKFRGTFKKEWRSSQGITRGLYNDQCLANSKDPIVITEGEIDAITCVQSGFRRSVSLPDGWTVDGGKRDVLVDYEAALRDSPYVIVAGDNDEAGASLPRTVANVLRGHDVRYVTWPDGCKDANDTLTAHGEVAVSRCLVEAKRVDPEGGFITGISDLPPMPARRVLKAGIPALDFCLAFEVGAMSVGTGTPGSGKSTLTTFVAYHVARNENIRIGFLSFETHPYRTRDHLTRLANGGLAWGDLGESEQAQMALNLDRHFRIAHRTYDAGTHNLGWLKEMVYTLAVRDNCKMIIIDPWNELEHMPEPGENMTSYINFALQQIRVWAEQYDTHICVVAHPRKMSTEGTPRSPTGYDIADSAAFFNKPSLGFSVHMDGDKDLGESFVMLSTWKVRDTQLYGIGKGSSKLRFDSQSMAYSRYDGY